MGHCSFKIVTKDSKVIYIDPYADELGYNKKADLILVSNSNYDHSARDKIRKLTSDYTRIITTKDNSGNINGEAIKVGQEIEIEDILLRAVSANSEKYPDAIGFLIKVDGKILYFTGSTKTIPNMDIKIDLMFVACGGTYTMNAMQASHAVETLMPKLVIPMHYGKVEGTIDDARHFSELLEHSDVKVLILEESGKISLFSE